MALWDEYAALETPESRLAKGLDRLETVLTHVQGANPPDFDHGFNLSYGRALTDAHPLIAALRAPLDAETARLAATAAGSAATAGLESPRPGPGGRPRP
jgi:putative hydrolase of HD superfamily